MCGQCERNHRACSINDSRFVHAFAAEPSRSAAPLAGPIASAVHENPVDTGSENGTSGKFALPTVGLGQVF